MPDPQSIKDNHPDNNQLPEQALKEVGINPENNPLTETDDPDELNRTAMLDVRGKEVLEDDRHLDRPRPKEQP